MRTFVLALAACALAAVIFAAGMYVGTRVSDSTCEFTDRGPIRTTECR